MLNIPKPENVSAEQHLRALLRNSETYYKNNLKITATGLPDELVDEVTNILREFGNKNNVPFTFKRDRYGSKL